MRRVETVNGRWNDDFVLCFTLTVCVTGRGEVHVHRELSEPAVRDAAGQRTKQTHTDADQRRRERWPACCQEHHRGWYECGTGALLCTCKGVKRENLI